MSKRWILSLIFILISAAVVVLYLTWRNPTDHIILTVRLPRLMLALLTGMILAGVGYVFQIMLNNPLAEPYILGVSPDPQFLRSNYHDHFSVDISSYWWFF